jgi:predicted PurR-regulated permease PerM
MIMYILVISLLSVLIALIVPPLTQELQNLTKMIDLLPLQNFVRNFKFDVNQINNFVSSFGGSVTTLWSIVNSTFSSLFTVLTITVISVYLLIDRDNLYKKISWFTRDKSQLEKAREFVDSVEVQLGGWIRGQLILMTIIGFVTYLGLLLLGIPYVLPLAILAGFLEILPNLGPTIASLPSIALAYVYGGWVLAGATALFYLIVQQLENNIVVPKIMKANADVNPLATIVTILVGLKMGGIVGALLSVPLYILIRAIYGMIRNDLIGKE